MKKIVASFLAGVLVTTLAFVAFNQIAKQRYAHLFAIWTQNKTEKIVSLETDGAGVVAILKNVSANAKKNRNMTSSRWGQKRILITSNNSNELFVDIELKDEQWKKIGIYDMSSHHTVNVRLEENGSFDSAQIIGDTYMSTDKDLDGLIDTYAEYPPRLTGEDRSKIFYVTNSGTVEKCFGESLVEEETNREYKLTWNGSDWEKEYTD